MWLDGVKVLGGIACLTINSLEGRVSMVSLDEFSRLVWIRISGLAHPP